MECEETREGRFNTSIIYINNYRTFDEYIIVHVIYSDMNY